MTDVFDLNKDRTDTRVDYVKQLKWQVSYVFSGQNMQKEENILRIKEDDLRWELK